MPTPIHPWYWPEKGQPERTEPFTWIVEGVIAASWWPDYGVPTDAQIEWFLELMDKHHQAKEPVVIHCVAGCGRTGQFIIAWCAKAGFISRGTNPVDWIRARRKCCLETLKQIACARRVTAKFGKA